MKKKPDYAELLAHAIDKTDAPLPLEQMEVLSSDTDAYAEWQKLQAWAELLRQDDQPAPDEAFYHRLVDSAVREVRRAELTESTRRDLQLDGGWLPKLLNTFSINRWVPATVLAIVLAIPSFLFIQNQLSTVGTIQYATGNVIVQAGDYLEGKKDQVIAKNAMIQTAQGAEAVLQLDEKSEVLVDSLSRIAIVDARTIKLEKGRAFFEVEKGNGDFLVLVPGGEVRVLGTAFEVSVNRDENTVTVTDGVVAVSNSSGAVRVPKGSDGVMTFDTTPAVQQSTRIQNTAKWVSALRKRQNEDELKTYYPSLSIERK